MVDTTSSSDTEQAQTVRLPAQHPRRNSPTAARVSEELGQAIELAAMLCAPRGDPLLYVIQILLHVVGRVAGNLVNNVVTVGTHGLVYQGLEDLTLHVVFHLLLAVAPVQKQETRVSVMTGLVWCDLMSLSIWKIVPGQVHFFD